MAGVRGSKLPSSSRLPWTTMGTNKLAASAIFMRVIPPLRPRSKPSVRLAVKLTDEAQTN
jgi:hypothetical protein